MSEPVEAAPGGIRLNLQVQPRASRTELAGLHGDALKVRIASPPVGGAANRELIHFLAELFEVPRSNVELVAGLGSRRKIVLIHGVAVEAAKRRLRL